MQIGFAQKTNFTKALLPLELECYSALGETSVLRWHFLSLAAAILMLLASPARAQVQQQHEMDSKVKSLSEQIKDLSYQVSELQTRVSDQGVSTTAMKENGDERRLKMSMGTLGGVSQVTPQQSIASSANNQMQGMNMMSGMMSMMNSMMSGMGGMPGSAPMGPPGGIGGGGLLSSLPGFPGASHLYHIGSTNFFLDHPDHITLSLEQQNRLSKIRMNALMRRSEFNRKIQEREEQLWLLTASDQPNLSLVEAKIREVEKLRGDLRLTFIKNVGEAAKVLTDAQRMALLGQSTQSATNIMPSTGGTQSSGAMGDM